eukprot:CAMPEP_0170553460 /NCGR_PEP_ID=MMETSP0211-20121228/11283_1 /TAXON_ID=311385 /ORGANISM="Pseudokeronopsis sp., Strain OXSARD2" /LENGTH=145 /DNA_ID=CAMNT_0010861799 /DNA_START=366 /DNA_END=803 /DNA_ORIENTATION=+
MLTLFNDIKALMDLNISNIKSKYDKEMLKMSFKIDQTTEIIQKKFNCLWKDVDKANEWKNTELDFIKNDMKTLMTKIDLTNDSYLAFRKEMSNLKGNYIAGGGFSKSKLNEEMLFEDESRQNLIGKYNETFLTQNFDVHINVPPE